jgi:hypothetical protein
MDSRAQILEIQPTLSLQILPQFGDDFSNIFIIN